MKTLKENIINKILKFEKKSICFIIINIVINIYNYFFKKY